MWRQYRKFILSALASLAIVAQTVLSDGQVTAEEWWLIVTTVAGSAGVIVVYNDPKSTANRDSRNVRRL